MKLDDLPLYVRDLKARFVAGDFSLVLTKIRAAMQADVMAEFDSSQTPWGTPWEPLADGSGRRPLVKSGNLLAGVLESVSNAEIGRSSIRIRYGGPAYGMFHQTGTATIPARPFWGICQQRVDEFTRMLTVEATKVILGKS